MGGEILHRIADLKLKDTGIGKWVLSQTNYVVVLQDGFYDIFQLNKCKQWSTMNSPSAHFCISLTCWVIQTFYPMELFPLTAGAAVEYIHEWRSEMGRDVMPSHWTVHLGHCPLTQWSNSSSFLQECKRLCAKGLSVMVTLHSDGVNNDMLGPFVQCVMTSQPKSLLRMGKS